MPYPAKPYARLLQSWIDNMTHAERDIPTPLNDAARMILRHALAQAKADDGDPTTWTHCEHCDGSGEWSDPATDKRGMCFQCRGKGRQSAADRKRNWGYMRINAEEEMCNAN
jgi:DnaJ-class molecular chaperone